MLKAAIQYLVGLKENKTYDINGETYSDHELVRIAPHVDRPREIQVNGLSSIAALVREEIFAFKDRVQLPIYIRIIDAREVAVFTSYDDMMARDALYRCSCDAPSFRPGWMEHDEAVIKLRSIFVQDGDISDLEYVMDLLSRVSKESSVTSSDNGISQTVEARQGVALSQRVKVRPIVRLTPYRTFLEVEQPTSECLLRLDEDGRVGLLEADGGRWKMDAKQYISEFFHRELKNLIDSRDVVILA